MASAFQKLNGGHRYFCCHVSFESCQRERVQGGTYVCMYVVDVYQLTVGYPTFYRFTATFCINPLFFSCIDVLLLTRQLKSLVFTVNPEVLSLQNGSFLFCSHNDTAFYLLCTLYIIESIKITENKNISEMNEHILTNSKKIIVMMMMNHKYF
jgi:hypothetical protein